MKPQAEAGASLYLPDDYAAIIQLQTQYALAIDTRNWPWFRSLFTADVVADYESSGAWSHTWIGLDDWVEAFEAMHDEEFSATQHRMSTHGVIVRGGEAWAMCYGDITLRQHADQNSVLHLLGYYDDFVVRGDSGWRIARRKFREIFRDVSASEDSSSLASIASAAEAQAIGFVTHGIARLV